MNIKEQCNLLIKLKGRCVDNYPYECKQCVFDVLCTKDDKENHVLNWAIKLKKNNYDVEATLFEEVL